MEGVRTDSVRRIKKVIYIVGYVPAWFFSCVIPGFPIAVYQMISDKMINDPDHYVLKLRDWCNN